MTRQDISLVLTNRPGALAAFGEVLGTAGVSLDGGGVFATADGSIAHFLVHDGPAARRALEQAGLGPVAVNDVIMVRLEQTVSGQLGLLARRMADANVNIAAQYSDHDGNLILLVSSDDRAAALSVADAWVQAGDH